MKIVVMGSAQGHGGLQTHFRMLVPFLIREGHQVGAINVADSAEGVVRGNAFTYVMPHTVGSPWATLRKSLGFLFARRRAARFMPELFIGTAIGRAYAQIAQSLPAKTFKIWEEVWGEIPKNDPLRIHVSGCFDAVAAQSPLIAKIFQEQIPCTKPVRVLPCFAEPLNFTALPTLPAQDAPLRLCFFGRLAKNKGVCEFLRAFARVAPQVNATFDIHGSGPEKPAIAELIASLGLKDRVSLLGPYPGGDEYSKLLASYHCLVAPSRGYEGVPLVLIEAMNCGLPFLATSIGAIPDAARNNEDVLLMPLDEDGMIASLQEFSLKVRSGTVSCARLKNFYDQHFSPAVMEQSWREMLSAPRMFFS